MPAVHSRFEVLYAIGEEVTTVWVGGLWSDCPMFAHQDKMILELRQELHNEEEEKRKLHVVVQEQERWRLTTFLVACFCLTLYVVQHLVPHSPISLILNVSRQFVSEYVTDSTKMPKIQMYGANFFTPVAGSEIEFQ